MSVSSQHETRTLQIETTGTTQAAAAGSGQTTIIASPNIPLNMGGIT